MILASNLKKKKNQAIDKNSEVWTLADDDDDDDADELLPLKTKSKKSPVTKKVAAESCRPVTEAATVAKEPSDKLSQTTPSNNTPMSMTVKINLSKLKANTATEKGKTLVKYWCKFSRAKNRLFACRHQIRGGQT